VHPDISGSHTQMVKLYTTTMYNRFISPQGYEYEIRPLTKSEQDRINDIEANKMLGVI